MIRRDMSLQDIDPRFLTCFADKSADPFCTLTTQCFKRYCVIQTIGT